MDEKTIITGRKFNSFFIVGLLLVISLSVFAIYFCVCSILYGGYTMEEFLYTDGGAIIPKILAPLFFCISLWAIFFTEIAVTDKRVYGKTMFGQRVDLPIDSISSVGFGAFHGIYVGTSSGKISFSLILNNKEIHKAINDLLINRQEKNNFSTVVERNKTVNLTSNADELKKYKDLLDSGVISQEEFDAKKKQILGL